MNKIDLGYTTSTIKKYWCHLCKRDFSKIYIQNIEVQCSLCGGTFCEELEENENNSNSNHPSHFLPFDSSSRSNHNRHANSLFMLGSNRPRSTSSFLDMIINYLGEMNFEDDLENIINQIMMSDTNRYGNPPASKKAIEELVTFEVNVRKIKEFGIENSCAVCKEIYELKQHCIQMPCQHHFHKDCLLPWLKERNSCPVCRKELLTDDEDYEKKKKKENNNY